MRGLLRRRNGTGDIRMIPSTPPIPPDWKRYADLNAKRVSKYGEEARITPAEWEELWYDAQRPKPAERRMSRDEIKRLQDFCYKHNREPLSAAEICELAGVDNVSIKEELDQVEANFAAAIAAGDRQIEEWRKFGLPLPEGTRERMIAEAKAERDAAIPPLREKFFGETVPTIRSTHRPLAYQAKVAATPSVSDDTARRMAVLLKACRGRGEIERLHAQCLSAGDDAAAFYLEQTAGAELDGMDKTMWQSLADAQRDRRAGPSLARIREDEDSLRVGVDLLNAHPTSGEVEEFAAGLGFADSSHIPNPQANLKLPDPEPIF